MFLLLLAALAAPNPGRHDKPAAAGQTVMLLRTDTPAEPLQPGDPPVSLSATELPALREEGGRVLVRSQGRDGWVPRADVLTPKEAVAYYTQQIQANPQNTSWYVRRAKAYELLADWDSAIKDYDELLKLSPRSSAYWNNRANYYSRRRSTTRPWRGTTRPSRSPRPPTSRPGTRGTSSSACGSGTRLWTPTPRRSRRTRTTPAAMPASRPPGGRSGSTTRPWPRPSGPSS